MVDPALPPLHHHHFPFLQKPLPLPPSADASESAGCDLTRETTSAWPEIPDSQAADWLAGWLDSLKAKSLRAKRWATWMCDCLLLKPSQIGFFPLAALEDGLV